MILTSISYGVLKAKPYPSKILFNSLAENVVFNFPKTVRVTSLEKFLPDESISITYFIFAVSVAYAGDVHDSVSAALNESEGAGATFVVEATNVGTTPFL